MAHSEPHPAAGRIVFLAGGFMGAQVRIIDWDDRLYPNRTWRDATDDASARYSRRRPDAGLPLDDEVVAVQLARGQALFHVEELATTEPPSARLLVAAAAIANEGRTLEGLMPLGLEGFGLHVQLHALSCARVALAALDGYEAALRQGESAATEKLTVPVPRRRGPLTESDVEALRLDLDAGSLLILSRDRGSRAAAALSAAAADTALLGHEEAHLLWRAVGACLQSFPAEQPATEGPAS